MIQEGLFAGLEKHGYGRIEMDPPWSWVSYAGKGAAPHTSEEAPYSVMSMAELKALPVADLAAKDCLLNMWVIGSHLDQAIELGKHYGFTFKSDGFVWVKTGKHDPNVRPIGMGKLVRKQVEYSLLFTRGSPKRLDAGIRQLMETGDHVIYEPRREHSRKPDCRYERLERLVGGPGVELFARQSRPGWSSWGDQASKFNSEAKTPHGGLIMSQSTQGETSIFDILGLPTPPVLVDPLTDILG